MINREDPLQGRRYFRGGCGVALRPRSREVPAINSPGLSPPWQIIRLNFVPSRFLKSLAGSGLRRVADRKDRRFIRR